MDDAKIAAIIEAVVRELKASGAVRPIASSSDTSPAPVSQTSALVSAVPVKPHAGAFNGNS